MFVDLTRTFGLEVQPFQLSSRNIHAKIISLLRRANNPFLWLALLVFGTEENPNEVDLMSAAIHAEKLQRMFRGIDEP